MFSQQWEQLLKTVGFRKERWRVQAFLQPQVTGGAEHPYQPVTFATQRAANRQVRKLKESFPPGDVRINCERI